MSSALSKDGWHRLRLLFSVVRTRNDRTENAAMWAHSQKGFTRRLLEEFRVLPKNAKANIKMTNALISFALVDFFLPNVHTGACAIPSVGFKGGWGIFG